MGGHAAGEVASHVAVEAIEAFVETTSVARDKDFVWPFGFDPSLGVDGTRLVTAFRLANRAIDVHVAVDPALRGMATTAVALLLDRETGSAQGAVPTGMPTATEEGEPQPVRALLAHVGDSRAYLWRDGALTRQTQDHSWVEEQMVLGTLTEADARHHPWRHLVTRAISGVPDPRVDVTPLVLEPRDRVLLCSDGLTTPVTDDLIASVMSAGARGDVASLCRALVDAANDAGGPDNITVVVVEIL
jgi:protein phosphatase